MHRSKSKSDLLATIDSQKDQLQRYETRLRDVVKAYKSLVKEKEALHASVTAMSEGSAEGREASVMSDASAGSADEKDKVNDPLRSNIPAEEQRESSGKLQEQVATLSKALSTITHAKAAMESNFQADKKKMIREHELAVEGLSAELEERGKTVAQQDAEIKQLKAALRSEQYEREKETSDFAGKIKHMQQLLCTEQQGREEREREVEALHAKLHESQERSVQGILEHAKRDRECVQHDKKLNLYENEVQSLKRELKDGERKARAASEEQQRLVAEVTRLKHDQEVMVESERRKVKESEERAKVVLNTSESRILSLEGKVSELSSIIGTSEKVSQDDQLTIHHLKERIHQLEIEKHGLDLSEETDDAKLGLVRPGLQERQPGGGGSRGSKLSLVRNLLQSVVQESSGQADNPPLNVVALLREWGCVTAREESDLHKGCREEYRQLLNEYDTYRMNIPLAPVVAVKTAEQSDHDPLVESLRAEVRELEEKLRAAQYHSETEHARLSQVVADLHQQLVTVESSGKAEVERVESEHRVKIANLTHHMQTQRERTMQLVQEKAKEVEALQNTVESLRMGSNRDCDGMRDDGEGGGDVRDGQFSMSQLSAAARSGKLDASSKPLIHYVEEMARYEMEMGNMRRSKFQLETALRELQLSGSTKEERYVDQIDLLKEEIRKLERNQSRESANLEYLKNVIISWVQCHNHDNKAKMMNAIATILQFSPKEKDAVLKAHGGWWPLARPTSNQQ